MIESSPKEQRLYGARASPKCGPETADSSYYEGGNEFESIVVDINDKAEEKLARNVQNQSYSATSSISGRLKTLVATLVARKKGELDNYIF